LSAAGPLSIHLAAREAPRREALLAPDGALDFEGLARRVGAAQASLRGLGLEPGARVAVAPKVTRAAVIGLSALLEEGLVPCLLHPRWPEALRAAQAERAGAAARLDLEALGGAPPAPPPPPREERSAEADLAIFFTSGTSGCPKGVRLSRRAFAASARGSAAHLGWRDDDRWLLNLPLAHIGGFSILTRTRLGRRAVVLPPPGGFDPRAFVEHLERQAVTLASLVPTMLARVLDLGLAPPPSLRALLLGGAPAPAAVLEDARRLGWPALTTYGLTEACSQVTVQPVGRPPDSGEGAGAPLPGVAEVRVLDGRIRVRGPILASGYLPGDGPLLDGDELVTGDLGRLEGDRLFVEGRASDLILSGGENVSPVRVEEALRALPEIEDAVVYGLPDPEWGEVVAASVVLAPGAGPGPATPDALLPRLRARLASFERPRRVRVVPALPVSANGKIDRRRARIEAESVGKS
jgi:O-succinylbenzoic acid--CoA ligase